jgi:nascent polypeptide-associated complex subunit alpha
MSAEEVNTQKPEEHVHGENCEHDHEDEKTGGKGEKKVRKALAKLGMTKVEGVNRVTLRQKDNYVLIVKDPEVYTSQQTENTYIIFGELTIDDPDRKLAKEEIDRMRAEGEQVKPQAESEKKETIEVVDENEEVSEEGLDPAQIETVMAEGNCSRQKAIKALRANNNDLVMAIMNLNN